MDGFECPRPVAIFCVRGKQNIAHPSVSQRQKGLNIVPFGNIMDDADLFVPAKSGHNLVDFSCHLRDVRKGMTFKRRAGLGNERIDAQGNTTKFFPALGAEKRPQ